METMDPINRQAAIDAARDWYEGLICGSFKGLEKRLRALPSAQPYSETDIQKIQDLEQAEIQKAYELGSLDREPQWIPCNERLPETVDVLCCSIHGEICIAYPYANKESCTGYSAESDSVYMIDCIAWMQLPEPYKERREE